MSDNFFTPGKISIILDASAGSSGKGKIGSHVTMANKGKYHFVCNTFSIQASHWVYDRKDSKSMCFKQFNSCAHRHEEFEKMYLGQGSVIDVKTLFKEIEMTGIPHHKIGISPYAAVLQEIDTKYEEGKMDFAGNDCDHNGTIKTGSTCSGVGASRARKVLRDKNALVAKDVPELQEFICDVTGEILDRLAQGQSGLGECCQGFQLSNGYNFFPNVTSRNVTVSAFLDDMMLPVTVVGDVLINLRTYPIRIASKKYKHKESGKFLTWDEVQASTPDEYEVIESYSGDGYTDQVELTWEQVEEQYGREVPIDVKLTSLTKLPRRVFTFSKQNLIDAIKYNQVPGKVLLSLNFVNWLDGEVEECTEIDQMTHKVWDWIADEIEPITKQFKNVKLKYLGTGRYTEDTVTLFDR